MRVLEINGFSETAFDYDGQHEVKRFLLGRGQNRTDDKRVADKALLGTKQEVEAFKPEVMVCRAAGRSYGHPAWKRPIKYFSEVRTGQQISRLKEQLGIPLGIIDTSDDLAVHPANWNLLQACDYYFKRELAMDPFLSLGGFESSRFRRPERKRRLEMEKYEISQKLKPLTLGVLEPVPQEMSKPFADRAWDLFYAGDDSLRPLREDGQKLLDSLEKSDFRVFRPTKRLSKIDYFKVMGDSRVVFSPPGFGWDCHRHYEAALLGCVVLTSFPNIRRCPVLRDRESALFYDPSATDQRRLQLSLQDRDALSKIAEKGRLEAEEKASHQAIFAGVVKKLASVR